MAKEKKVFVYEAVNSKGQPLKGEIRATTSNVAKSMLRRQGLVKIKLKKINTTANTRQKKIKSNDIANFVREMATMQGAGIPLVRALGIINAGTQKRSMRNMITKLKEQIEGGLTFSKALKNFPDEFDELLCGLVEAGEQSGKLDTILDRIATYRERIESIKRKLKKAMYYPTIVVIIAAIVIALLLIKVIPTFKELFEGFNTELPAFTKWVLSLSEYLQDSWYLILGGIAFSVYFFYNLYKKSTSFKHTVERYSLKIPLFGKIVRDATIARFARTLATTFTAGVPLTESLASVAKACGNIVFYNGVIKIREDVASGHHLHTAMLKSELFPYMVTQMIAVGEESGSLEDMLTKIAEIYEDEVDTSIDGLTTLLEPTLMTVLGLIIGALVVAMYLPIFKLGSVL